MHRVKYPIYIIKWTTSQGTINKRTSVLKDFLKVIRSLKNLKTFKFCSWTIIYAPKQLARFFYDGGKKYDYFKNESLVYSDPVSAYKDVLIFTKPDELKSCL